MTIWQRNRPHGRSATRNPLYGSRVRHALDGVGQPAAVRRAHRTELAAAVTCQRIAASVRADGIRARCVGALQYCHCCRGDHCRLPLCRRAARCLTVVAGTSSTQGAAHKDGARRRQRRNGARPVAIAISSARSPALAGRLGGIFCFIERCGQRAAVTAS